MRSRKRIASSRSAAAVDVPRQRTRLPQTALHILQGALPGRDAIGYKAYTSNRSGVRFLVHLFSASTGALRAVLEADLLGMMRTGAASGVATRALARPDAEIVGLFGAGWQAEGHLEAIAAVRPLRRVKVFARNAERLAALRQDVAAPRHRSRRRGFAGRDGARRASSAP